MAGSSGRQIQQLRRPYPGETLIPIGHEATAHPIFFMLLRQPPSPPRLQKVTTTGNTSALLSLEAASSAVDAAVPGPSGQQEKDAVDSICPICRKDCFNQPAAIIDEAAIEGKPVNTQCRHVYCYETCLKPWFQNETKNTNLCPLCKAETNWLLILTDRKFKLVAVGFDAPELEERPYPSREVLGRARRRLESVKSVISPTAEKADGARVDSLEKGGASSSKDEKRRRRGRRSDDATHKHSAGEACSSSAEEAAPGSGTGKDSVEKYPDSAMGLEGTGGDWLARELQRLDRQIETGKKRLKVLADEKKAHK